MPAVYPALVPGNVDQPKRKPSTAPTRPSNNPGSAAGGAVTSIRADGRLAVVVCAVTGRVHDQRAWRERRRARPSAADAAGRHRPGRRRPPSPRRCRPSTQGVPGALMLTGDGFGLGFGRGAAATGALEPPPPLPLAPPPPPPPPGRGRRGAAGCLHEQLGVHPRVLDIALEHLPVGGGRADSTVSEARIEDVRPVSRRAP